MTDRIKLMLNSFTALRSAQSLAEEAKNGKTSAWSGLMTAVADAYMGADVAALNASKDDISSAYKQAYQQDAPKATVSELQIFARASADGTYPNAVKAWDSWKAHCATTEGTKSVVKAGQKYQTMRDLLRYAPKYALTFGGIVEMRNAKATDATRLLGAAIRACEAVHEVEILDMSGVIASLNEAMPKKETAKRRVVRVVVDNTTSVPVETAPQTQPEIKAGPVSNIEEIMAQYEALPPAERKLALAALRKK